MEQKVIPIILNGKDSAERMKEITDRLETGIQQLFDSDRYKAYLTTMAKFHKDSWWRASTSGKTRSTAP